MKKAIKMTCSVLLLGLFVLSSLHAQTAKPPSCLDGFEVPAYTDMTLENSDLEFGQNIIIHEGAKLTLKNCTLRLCPNTKIIVMNEDGVNNTPTTKCEGRPMKTRGGILELTNNTLLTSNVDPALGNPSNPITPWWGIEVWGPRNSGPVVYNNPPNGWCGYDGTGGALIMRASTIENCLIPFRNHESYIFNGEPVSDFRGGIIDARDCDFRNYKIGAMFYNNLTSISEFRLTRSKLVDCRFTTDNLFLNVHDDLDYEPIKSRVIPSKTGVYINDYNRVLMESCTFENLDPTTFTTNKRGIGILGFDAGIYVLPTRKWPAGLAYHNQTPPIHSRNVFRNLTTGINCQGTDIMDARIENCLFENVDQGIYLKGLGAATVKENELMINKETLINVWGIELENIELYSINDNTLEGGGLAGISILSGQGITVKSTQLGGEIRRNSISNFKIGLQTEGVNKGVALSCNILDGYEQAMILGAEYTLGFQSITQLNSANFLDNQGSNCGSSSMQAGNQFLQCNTFIGYHQINTVLSFDYYNSTLGNSNPAVFGASTCVREGVHSWGTPQMTKIDCPVFNPESCENRIDMAPPVGNQKIRLKKFLDGLHEDGITSLERRIIIGNMVAYLTNQGDNVEVINQLENVPDQVAQKILVKRLIREERYVDARNVLSGLQGNSDEIVHFKQFHTMEINIFEQGRTWNQATANEMQTLVNLKSTFSSAKMEAEMVLERMGYGRYWNDPLESSTSSLRKSPSSLEKRPITLRIFPNPSSSTAKVQFDLGEISKAHAILLDGTGRKVLILNLDETSNIFTIPQLTNGLYQLIIITNEGIIHSEKYVQN